MTTIMGNSARTFSDSTPLGMMLYWKNIYSKTCVKWLLSKRQKIGFQDQLGDNCTQNFHLRRNIIGHMVGNLVLR